MVMSDQPRDGGSAVKVTFAGCGDAFGSGGRLQACIDIRHGEHAPVLADCGATSLSALRRCGFDPGEIGAVFVSTCTETTSAASRS